MSRVDRSRLPEPGPDRPFRLPTIARHTLANGLEVVALEHRNVPVVSFVANVAGGLGADPAGHGGLAALTADMLDEGIDGMSAVEVSNALARIGGDLDVDVGSDATQVSLTTLARFAERGSALLERLLAAPDLRDTDFERVQQLRLDRLRQLRDVPGAVAERVYLRQLYGSHPYGHLAIGDEPGLQASTADDVRRCYASTFAPGRTTLVVVGAFDHDRLFRIVDDAFGGWRSPAAGPPAGPLAEALAPAPPPSSRLALVPRPGAAQSELRIGQLTVSRSTPDYMPLVVMNAILGGQFVSRINLKLREEKAFTYGARTGFDWRRGVSPIGMQASVHTAATAEAVSDTLDEFSALRGARPPSDAEMQSARAALTAGFPRNFESAGQVARSVAQLALYGLPDTYFEEFVPRIRAVTADDVTRVARAHIDPASMTVVVVGDPDVVERPLGALGLGDPVVLSPSGQPSR